MWTKFSIYETFFPETVFENVAKLKSFTTNFFQYTHTHTLSLKQVKLRF